MSALEETGPPERKGPAIGLQSKPGHHRSVATGVDFQTAYDGGTALSTAAVTVLNEVSEVAEPLYVASWGEHRENDELAGFCSILEPWHGNWTGFETFDHWWQAMAKAIELAKQHPRCVYAGRRGGVE